MLFHVALSRVSLCGSRMTWPCCHTAAPNGMYPVTDECVKPQQRAAWGSLGQLQQIGNKTSKPAPAGWGCRPASPFSSSGISCGWSHEPLWAVLSIHHRGAQRESSGACDPLVLTSVERVHWSLVLPDATSLNTGPSYLEPLRAERRVSGEQVTTALPSLCLKSPAPGRGPT